MPSFAASGPSSFDLRWLGPEIPLCLVSYVAVGVVELLFRISYIHFHPLRGRFDIHVGSLLVKMC